MLDPTTNTLYRSFGENSGNMSFPRNIGLTGQCMAIQDCIVVKKMPNRSFKEEVDNVLNLKIGNMISAPLFNRLKTEVVGVIHIYNRERETTDVDMNLFKNLNHIVGCCIDNANQWARVAGMIDYDIKEAVLKFTLNQEKYENVISSSKKLNDFMNTRSIKRNRNLKNFDDFRVQIKQREYMLRDITKYLLLKSKHK